MVTATETKQANGGPSQLRKTDGGTPQCLQWLILAPQNPMMLERLSQLTSDCESAVLPTPDGWQPEDHELTEAVRSSILEGRVEHLLIVGHSEAAVGDDTIDSRNGSVTEPTDQPTSGFSRLIDGARQSRENVQRAKDDFADQVAKLCRMPVVKQGVLDGTLNLHALFYVAESGAFLLFDIANKSFVPLARQ